MHHTRGRRRSDERSEGRWRRRRCEERLNRWLNICQPKCAVVEQARVVRKIIVQPGEAGAVDAAMEEGVASSCADLFWWLGS